MYRVKGNKVKSYKASKITDHWKLGDKETEIKFWIKLVFFKKILQIYKYTVN